MENKYYEFKMKLPVVQTQVVNLLPDEIDKIAAVIRHIGDVQKRKTNVKASMTDWYLHTQDSLVGTLCDEAIEIATAIHPKSFNPPEFYTRKCWGAVYNKGDFTKPHNHTPNVYSWCFYAHVPKGSAPLEFPDADLTIHPEEGDIILFSGLARHSVPPCEVDNRIVVAGNIGVK